MPYIAKTVRDNLDPKIDALISRINTWHPDQRAGITNYAITRIVSAAFAIPPIAESKPWRYANAMQAYGTFMAAAAEFYRRVLGPVEDDAIKRNGDIEEYTL